MVKRFEAWVKSVFGKYDWNISLYTKNRMKSDNALAPRPS